MNFQYDDRKAERQDDFSRLMREMKFEARVQPGQKMKSREEIEKEELEEKQKKMSEMKARMKEDSEDEDDNMESVEKIPEKKEEVKEAAPLAYDMESGTLLNNREELSEALKNIRKCDSDGEEIDDDDESEDDGEDEGSDEDESEDNEDGGEILNPIPKFDSDGEAEEGAEAEDEGEDDDEDDDEDGSEGEDEPKAKKKKLNPMTIQDVEDDEDAFGADEDEPEDKSEEPKRKKKKLEPILTQVSQKGDSILSSYAKFRSALKKLEIGERITLVNSLCKKITSGTDADRQAKLRSLFQFSILSFMRNELYDVQGKSIGRFS